MEYRNRKRALILLLSYIFLLYSMIPLVRPVTNYLRDHNYLSFTIITLIICAVLPLAFFYFKDFKFKAKNIILLFLVLICYGLGINFATTVEEKAHLLQYGLLAILFYNFFKCFNIKTLTCFILCFLFCSLIGWGDEVIQYYIPERFFDWRDVLLNAYSSLLGLFLIYIKLQG